jgi:hypothetical protein
MIPLPSVSRSSRSSAPSFRSSLTVGVTSSRRLGRISSPIARKGFTIPICAAMSSCTSGGAVAVSARIGGLPSRWAMEPSIM